MFACGLRFSLVWAAIGMALAHDCLAPMQIANSHYEVNEETVTYYCNGGFRFEGKVRESRCQKKTWETIKFTCQLTCGAPPTIPNMNLIKSREESAIYKCRTNFIDHEIELKCENNNQWENTKIQCPEEIMPIDNISTSFYENSTSDEIGTTNVPEKKTMPIDNISTSFYENSTSDEIGTTIVPEIIEGCGPIHHVTGSTVTIDGNTANFICEEGFLQEGNVSISICENGIWSEINTSCVSKDFGNCSAPMDIPNSIMQWDDEGYIIYTCKPGYIEVGNISTSFCENDTWTEITMTCFREIIEGCGPIHHVTGSTVTIDGNTANFICEEGFLQEGNVSISICENGIWSEINTSCVSKAPVSKEYTQRQKSKAFQVHLENSSSLICSFIGNEQICRCNNNVAIISIKENQKIAMHNSFSLPVKSLKDCENFCLHNESCLSFEFKKSIKICHLSKTASYFVESVIIMEDEDVIYGQKECVDSITANYTSMTQPSFNLNAVPFNSLLCSISPEIISCGCVGGAVAFKEYPNKKILKHNMQSISIDVDAKKCLNLCEGIYDCLSAEFKHDKKICHLSKTAHYLADEYIFRYSPNTVYFEKVCIHFFRCSIRKERERFLFLEIHGEQKRDDAKYFSSFTDCTPEEGCRIDWTKRNEFNAFDSARINGVKFSLA